MSNSIVAGFVESTELFGARPALYVERRKITYTQLRRNAVKVAAAISDGNPRGAPHLTAVFALRSATAYIGVLGALLAGHGYVPLNRRFPVQRTQGMLRRSGCRSLVVDAASEPQLAQLLDGIDGPLLILLPERNDVTDLRQRWPAHTILGGPDLPSLDTWSPPSVAADSVAYLLFTSGSTGIPKGVMVSHRNVRSYVTYIADQLEISETDRFSQTFDLTFDLSAADMFVAWERGACLCIPTDHDLLSPGRYIADSGLTVWFSVPSTAVLMKALGSVKPRSYPKLRVSMFCGEALPVEIARAWADAAPNSVVENLYGPTELTIACTRYRWDPTRSPSESHNGLTPIGHPFPGMQAVIVDEHLAEVEPGQPGELLMTGPQLSLGYWQDPEKTRAAFVNLLGRTERFYRTGDRVLRSGSSEPIHYLGRVDNQIKILGHRVELGEVEAVVRQESGIDAVVAVGWPRTISGAGGIEVFIQGTNGHTPALSERIRKRLPTYMTPRRYHYVPKFPLNANGKYDRNALLALLAANSMGDNA